MKRRIEDILSTDGVYVSPTMGVSMRPMLRQGRDRIIVVPVTGRLKRYDVPLYRRGKDYVLHRIVKVRPDDYVVLGDNCLAKEYVRDEQIIGVLTAFYRGTHYVNVRNPFYRLYAAAWQLTHPLRLAAARFRHLRSALYRRLKGKNNQ